MEKGLIAIFLLLAFIPLLVSVHYFQFIQNQQLNQGMEDLWAIEKASLKRNELEQNTDLIIQETIQAELLAQNFNSNKIEEKVAENLFQYFQTVEQNAQPPISVSFSIAQTYQPDQYGDLKRTPKEKLLSEKDLEELIVIGIEKIGRLTVGNFYFTGGNGKNKVLRAEIKIENTSQDFLLPINYSETLQVIS